MYGVTRNGKVYSLERKGRKTTRVLNPSPNKAKGYLRVGISAKGKTKLVLVHKLVAITYIQNPNDLPMINHIDGNKMNNNVSNLEWCDGYTNRLHAFEMGLYPNQKIHPTKKQEIVALIEQGNPIKDVAVLYGLTYMGAYMLLRRYKAEQLRVTEQQTSVPIVIKARMRAMVGFKCEQPLYA